MSATTSSGHATNLALVRVVPGAVVSRCSKNKRLLDHIVGAAGQGQRDGDAERLRSLEVKEQFNFRAPLDRQLARFFPFDNTSSVDAGQTVRVGLVAAIARQAASGDELAAFEDRRHPVADCQCGELCAST